MALILSILNPNIEGLIHPHYGMKNSLIAFYWRNTWKHATNLNYDYDITVSVELVMCVFFFLLPERLQVDVLKLQKENLVLEREKLQLQITLLNQKVAKMELKPLSHEMWK